MIKMKKIFEDFDKTFKKVDKLFKKASEIEKTTETVYKSTGDNSVEFSDGTQFKCKNGNVTLKGKFKSITINGKRITNMEHFK